MNAFSDSMFRSIKQVHKLFTAKNMQSTLYKIYHGLETVPNSNYFLTTLNMKHERYSSLQCILILVVVVVVVFHP